MTRKLYRALASDFIDCFISGQKFSIFTSSHLSVFSFTVFIQCHLHDHESCSLGITIYAIIFFLGMAFMMPPLFAISYSTVLSISVAKSTFLFAFYWRTNSAGLKGLSIHFCTESPNFVWIAEVFRARLYCFTLPSAKWELFWDTNCTLYYQCSFLQMTVFYFLGMWFG